MHRIYYIDWMVCMAVAIAFPFSGFFFVCSFLFLFCFVYVWIHLSPAHILLFNTVVMFLFACVLVCIPISKLVLYVISHGPIASYLPPYVWESNLLRCISYVTIRWSRRVVVVVAAYVLLLFHFFESGILVSLSLFLVSFRLKSHFNLETNLQTHLKAAQYVIGHFQELRRKKKY